MTPEGRPQVTPDGDAAAQRSRKLASAAAAKQVENR
jgi:hypothetical protein